MGNRRLALVLVFVNVFITAAGGSENNRCRLVLDVRSDTEWDAGHASCAHNLRVQEDETLLTRVNCLTADDTSWPIHVHGSDESAAAARSLLQTKGGFSDVVTAEGENWLQALQQLCACAQQPACSDSFPELGARGDAFLAGDAAIREAELPDSTGNDAEDAYRTMRKRHRLFTGQAGGGGEDGASTQESSRPKVPVLLGDEDVQSLASVSEAAVDTTPASSDPQGEGGQRYHDLVSKRRKRHRAGRVHNEDQQNSFSGEFQGGSGRRIEGQMAAIVGMQNTANMWYMLSTWQILSVVPMCALCVYLFVKMPSARDGCRRYGRKRKHACTGVRALPCIGSIIEIISPSHPRMDLEEYFVQ